MVAIPDALAWELIRKNNCFLKIVNGRTKRSGCVHFSVEKGNLRSISTSSTSGLSNSKTVDITASSTGEPVLSLKVKSKAHSYPEKGVRDIPVRKHFRSAERTIRSQVEGAYYRRDLMGAALAKYTCLYKANRRIKGVERKVTVKKGRKSLKK